MSHTTLSRRDFLTVSAVAGGMLLDIRLPRRAGQADGFAPNVFVRIGADDSVAITVAKSEMGQGVRTTLALLVAEELDADWERVRVSTADFDPKYGNQGTGGSGSVFGSWTPLRQAGATARAMLVEAAAKRWNVPASDCTTENGVVMHAASRRRARYGELAAAAAALPVPAEVPLKPRAQFRLLGRERAGKDVPDILHGRAKYGLDTRLEGMVYAVVERAPVFGAKVARYDTAPALRVPGVLSVVDVPAVPESAVHAGVAVVATNTWAANEGRKQLVVEWDTRGDVSQESSAAYLAAMREATAKTGAEVVNRIGDPDVVLGRAAKVFRAEYEFPFLHHATMEPMNCTARAHADGRIELWAPTQFPNWSAQAVAGALKLQPAQVTVHVTLIGGGFGRRINPDYSVEAALIAKQLDRPVQVVWTREDDMTHGMYRPIARHVLEASLDANGWPEAWRHRMATTAINGNPGPGTRPFGGGESDGVGNMGYRVPNRTTEYTPIASRAPRGWWRAVHTTHGTFALETFLDELAEAAGKDPLEYRLALLDQVPVTNPQPSRDTPFDPERMKGVLRLAAEKAGWGKPLPAGHAMGIACVQDHRTHAAEVVHASIEGGRLRIHEVVVAADCAFVVNPSGARAQMEGGVMQGLSAALHERVTLSGGAVAEKNFDRYRLLRISEAPVKVSAYFVEHPENTVRITGLGEPAVPIVAPALANAIYRITKKRIRTLPMGTAFA